MTARIDAHQHFWRPERGDYGWLTPALGPIHRTFEEADLRPHLRRHGIDATVLVQAAPTEAETDYLLALADRAGFAAGVVGWTDFEASDAPERIARRAEDARIVGFRPMIQDLPDDAWMLRDSVRPALRALIEAQLPLDALVKPRHLPHLLRLVEGLPGLRVVIDHGAKPEIARWTPGEAGFRDWAEQMRALAALGCWVKLSGLVTEAGEGWSTDSLRPCVDAFVEGFGPARMIWGSDWPVVNLAGGYDAWRRASEDLTGGWSEADRAALFGGSAARFYGLGDAGD